MTHSDIMTHQMEILSLEQLYEAYKNQIYTLCIRLSGSADDAADLFSDTWTRVAEKYGQIDHRQNVMNWIYTICVNIYRKSLSKNEIVAVYENIADFSQIASEHDNIAAAFIKKEDSEALRKSLRKLDNKYRIPIILFYFKDLSYNDIAKIMKLPMSTVKFRLNQAKNLLKKEMEVYFESR